MARGRWGDRALDQLAKRVDALEAAIARLLGMPAEHVRVGGLGAATWIGIAAVALPFIGTVLLILAGK